MHLSVGNFRKNLKTNFPWILAGLITLVVMILITVISRITPFGTNTFAYGDCSSQYVPFFSEFRRKLLSGENLFFSWNIASGTDFFPVFTYYLASPLNLLVVFFSKENLHLFVGFMVILKIVISSCTMGYYLCKRYDRSGNKIIITAFAVCYGLSSYTLGYYWNIMWLDCFMMLPLVIYGLYRLIDYKKPVLYILCLTYCMFTNFYIAFIICIFLVLYFFTFSFDNIKDFFSKLTRFALTSLLSVGMSFVTLLVTLLGLINSSAYNTDGIKFEWYANIFKILRGSYMLSLPCPLSFDQSEANVYAGTATFLLLFFLPFFTKISIKKRLYRIFVIIIMIISMNNSVLNYIWHGFHTQYGIPNRFTFVYLFFIIETAFILIKDIDIIKLKYFSISCIIAILMPLVIYFFTDYNGAFGSKAVLITALISSIVYCGLFAACTVNPGVKKVMLSVIGGLLIIEISVNAVVVFSNNDIRSIEYLNQVQDGRADAIRFVKEYQRDIDGFVREEIIKPSVVNENIYHNMHGISVFSSTEDKEQIYFMTSVGFETGISDLKYSGASPFMDDLLGVRFIHSNDDYEEYIDYNVIYKNDDGFKVYENADALPIGFGMSDEIKKGLSFYSLNGALNQNIIASTISEYDSIYDLQNVDYNISSSLGSAHMENELLFLQLEPESIDGSMMQVNLSYVNNEDGIYYLQVENEDIKGVYLDINGKSWYDKGYCHMIYLGKLNKNDKVTFSIVLPNNGDYRGGIPVFLSRYNGENEKALIEELSGNKLEVSDMGSNTLEGEFSLSEGQCLFTSIPYNEGWTVYVDGSKANYFPVMGKFIGVDADPGKHTISMKYIPQGFYIGIAVTVLSWIAFVALIVFSIKNTAVKKDSGSIEVEN